MSELRWERENRQTFVMQFKKEVNKPMRKVDWKRRYSGKRQKNKKVQRSWKDKKWIFRWKKNKAQKRTRERVNTNTKQENDRWGDLM